MLVLRSAALLAVCLTWGLWTAVSTARAADAEPVYELRVYTCEPGKLPALEERFRDHTMRLFEKHGMKNLAYWEPLDGPEAETTLIYILEHASRDAATKSWAAFRADPEWKQVAAASEQNHGKILAKPPTATFMAKTDYSPAIGLPVADKVYELRTYTAAEGKLDALNTRFRDYTVRLFDKYGMPSYGYWVPLDPPQSGDTLLYFLEHTSRDSAAASFKAFAADPEWKQAFTESQKNGSLTAKKPESQFLKLVDFSPRK
ncbi:NIPSNAP family protein [Planctomicrobium piriforme]|uniref:NIPSNAP protein n=1 Tax=Planctomicrobium piriforme TaxID=1576369 RepID=A0A1I3L9S3_9PLAN|nr:NIPSNAP family protein [Planctomicrobium piriforme]SFI81145.1 NIPSNAP protein [Planctomicrobium piriforme]